MKAKRYIKCFLAVSVFSSLLACSDYRGPEEIMVPVDINDPVGPEDPQEDPEITVMDSTATLVTKSAVFDYTATYKATSVPIGTVIDKVEIGAEIIRPKQNSSYIMTDWLYVGKEQYSDNDLTLFLSVAENTTMEERHAVVLLLNGADSLVFNVTQKGRTEPFIVFEERKDIALDAAQKQMFQANTAFAVDFFKEVYAREGKQEVMVSPFCVESAMCTPLGDWD